jgi:hypothetical protein
MDLSTVAKKLAMHESLTPEDVQLMQEAVRKYGVHNAAKLLDAQAAGMAPSTAAQQVPMIPPQTPAQQEETALVQAYGTPARMNQ